jgi:hypothetical protein
MLLQQFSAMKSWSISNVNVESSILELKTVSVMPDTEFTLTWVITQKDFIGVRQTFFYADKYNYTISNIKLMSETINDI